MQSQDNKFKDFGQNSNSQETPIPRDDGWAMGVFRGLAGEKWPRDIGSALYYMINKDNNVA